MSRISFQKDTHDVNDDPIGFSIRVHRIGTGKSRLISELEKKAIPGKLGELHTHASTLPRFGPNLTWENPGA